MYTFLLMNPDLKPHSADIVYVLEICVMQLNMQTSDGDMDTATKLPLYISINFRTHTAWAQTEKMRPFNNRYQSFHYN